MPSGTTVPFPTLIRPMHTENLRNRVLTICLLRDLWLDGKNSVVAEYAGMLRVKRSCSSRHNIRWVEARPASVESENECETMSLALPVQEMCKQSSGDQMTTLSRSAGPTPYCIRDGEELCG